MALVTRPATPAPRKSLSDGDHFPRGSPRLRYRWLGVSLSKQPRRDPNDTVRRSQTDLAHAMSWRPERPPALAVRVINASRELDAADKTVWREIHQLDRGPEGCYAKPAHFARRIGRSVDAMKKSRKRLADLGLVHRAPRRGPCPDSWFATLPHECWPPNNAKDEAVFPLADMLDGLIRRGGTYGDDAGDSDAVARGRAAVSQAVCATGKGISRYSAAGPEPRPAHRCGQRHQIRIPTAGSGRG